MPRITHPPRTARFYVRFAPDELAAARARAQAAGQAFAVYMRDIAIRGTAKRVSGRAEESVVRQLAHIAAALHSRSKTGEDSASVEIALQELMPILQRLTSQTERTT